MLNVPKNLSETVKLKETVLQLNHLETIGSPGYIIIQILWIPCLYVSFNVLSMKNCKKSEYKQTSSVSLNQCIRHEFIEDRVLFSKSNFNDSVLIEGLIDAVHYLFYCCLLNFSPFTIRAKLF